MRYFLFFGLFCLATAANSQLQFEQASTAMVKTWQLATVTDFSGESVTCEIRFDIATRPDIIEIKTGEENFVLPIRGLKKVAFTDSLGHDRSFIVVHDKWNVARLMEMEFSAACGAIVIGREIATKVVHDQYGVENYRNSKIVEKKYLVNAKTLSALPLSYRSLFKLFESQKQEIHSFIIKEDIYLTKDEDFKKVLLHLDSLM